MTEHNFTCITCMVKFPNSDMHRVHFKEDWHRYNLKRKVANLDAVSLDVFKSRKEAHEKLAKEEEEEAGKSSTYCIACGKNFKNKKAYENHIQSKKHQDMILKFEAKPAKKVKVDNVKEDIDSEDDKEMEVEEVDSDDWEDDDPIPPTECLFCPHHSANIGNNVKHMSEDHSFFLPDPEFLVNLEGLVEYLGAKVGQGHMCLWCNETGKKFETKEDVQRHMISKGHCKLLHEGEALLEYDEWYDYSSSYPDGEHEDIDKEEEVQLDTLDDSGFQLVLPSGATIGHRSLLRYYKQSLNPVKALVVSRAPHGMSSCGRQLVPAYRSLGWTGTSGMDAVKKARDLGHMRRMQNYHWQKIGVKANKLRGNTHFRDRNGMC